MLIENLAQNRVKICLNVQDLKLIGLDLHKIDCKNALSRNFLRTILTATTSREKLQIESYSIKDNGITIYFSPAKPAQNCCKNFSFKAKIYIYEFENANNLLSAFNALNFAHFINFTGDLYLLNKKYKLILRALQLVDGNILAALNEYGKRQNSSEGTIAHFKESGKTLFENKDLREIIALFK